MQCSNYCIQMLICFRTINPSRRNIPAAAGSADQATTSSAGSSGASNGMTNGVSSDEDMDVN